MTKTTPTVRHAIGQLCQPRESDRSYAAVPTKQWWRALRRQQRRADRIELLCLRRRLADIQAQYREAFEAHEVVLAELAHAKTNGADDSTLAEISSRYAGLVDRMSRLGRFAQARITIANRLIEKPCTRFVRQRVRRAPRRRARRTRTVRSAAKPASTSDPDPESEPPAHDVTADVVAALIEAARSRQFAPAESLAWQLALISTGGAA